MRSGLSSRRTWAGTADPMHDGGVSCFDGTRWKTHTDRDGFSGNAVRTLATDALGRVWAGPDNGGLFCFDGKTWEKYSTENGLIERIRCGYDEMHVFAGRGLIWQNGLGGVLYGTI